MWWCDRHIYCKIITTGQLVQLSPHMVITVRVCVWWVHLRSTLSNFQAYDTLDSPEITHLISYVLFDHHHPIPLSTLQLYCFWAQIFLDFFFFHIEIRHEIIQYLFLSVWLMPLSPQGSSMLSEMVGFPSFLAE